MRDAISLLDQLLSYGDEVLELARVEKVLGLVERGTIGKLVDLMAADEAGGRSGALNEMVAEGVELGQLADQIVAYLRAVLFVRVARAPELLDLPQDVVAVVARQAEALPPAALLIALREFMDARSALRDQVPGVPQLPIELAFLRAALYQAEGQVDKDASRQGGAVPAVSQPPPALVPAVTPERAAPSARPSAQVVRSRRCSAGGRGGDRPGHASGSSGGHPCSDRCRSARGRCHPWRARCRSAAGGPGQLGSLPGDSRQAVRYEGAGGPALGA